MSKFYSVEELSEILNLHPKTVQRFIREGKIKGRKIGRTWKVHSDDLREYAHAELAEPQELKKNVQYAESGDAGRVQVSAVVELKEKDRDEASRITNSMMAMLNHKDPSWGPCDFRVVQYPETGTARFVVSGYPLFVAEVMKSFSFVTTGGE